MDKTWLWIKRSATYATFYRVRTVYSPTDAERSTFLTQLLAFGSTYVTYIQYSRNRRGSSGHQVWHSPTEQKECRSFKAVRFTKRLEIRKLCVCHECSRWLALHNAWQLTLFYSVTWRNEMIYTHSHVSFCGLKIIVGYFKRLRHCLFGWDVYLSTALLTDSCQCSSRWVFSAAHSCYWVPCPVGQEILVSRRSTHAVGPTPNHPTPFSTGTRTFRRYEVLVCKKT
jgi:hypothetical protein